MKMMNEDLGLVHKGGDFSFMSNNNDHNNNINVVGNNKILPIGRSGSSSSTSSPIVDDQQQCGPRSLDRTNQNKTMAKMKELFRWAAATEFGKSAKFGRKFKNPSTIEGEALKDEEYSKNESPKISLKWEIEPGGPSFLYHYHRWITTDHDFVVLEL